MYAFLGRLRREETGLTTAEYAVGTCAAVGLGGLLMKLISSDKMADLLWGLISRAFDVILPF